MIATDLLRERVAHFMPDSRLTRSELAAEFSGLGGNTTIDFTLVAETDAMFAEGRERNEPEVGSPVLAQRAEQALRWLAALPDAHRQVGVVSHKHFLGALTGLYPENVAQRSFANAEHRQLLLCFPRADEAVGEPSTVKPVHARVKPLGSSEQS